jgi:hypothetical protein
LPSATIVLYQLNEKPVTERVAHSASEYARRLRRIPLQALAHGVQHSGAIPVGRPNTSTVLTD